MSRRLTVVLYLLIITGSLVFVQCSIGTGEEDRTDEGAVTRSIDADVADPSRDGAGEEDAIGDVVVTPGPEAEEGVPESSEVIEEDVPSDGAVTLEPEMEAEVPPEPTAQPTVATEVVGIAVLGDSNSDEYRADDNRGAEYEAVTLNWVEQLVLKRDMNFGPWGDWPEPRRRGYAYNWSRSGATIADMIESGQHLGVAQQVADGLVSHVVIFIGANDFHLRNGSYKDIYDGDLSEEGVLLKMDRFLENMTVAVDAILAAGDVDIVIIGVGDPGLEPGASARFPDAIRRELVSVVIDALNQRISRMAAQRGVAFVDLNEVALSMLDRVDENGDFVLAGEKIALTDFGNNPRNFRLGDGVGHPGTILSGMLANAICIAPFNEAFGTEIPPLSEHEILDSAGLR